MKKSIKKNYLYNLSYQILAIVLPIITTPYLARILGSEGTGMYSYTISIVTYFVLFGSLGISLYGQREIAYAQNNESKKNKIFTELIVLRFITMGLAAALFYFLFGRSGEYVLYYRILLLEMLASAIDICWLYQGLEEFKKIVFRNLMIKLLSVSCIFLFIKTPKDVAKYIAIYTLTTLFGNVSLWFRVRKYVQLDFKNFNMYKHIKPMLLLFIPQVAIQIYTVLDKTMLGTILRDMTEVGYYEQSQKIIKILLTIITSLGTVMLPRIASCYAKGDKERIKEYMKKSFSFIFLLSFPMVFGVIAVSHHFVPLFFGNGYSQVIPIISCMTLLMLLIGISSITGNQLLLPTQRQKQYTISVVIGAFINFILNLALISQLKSMGAAIATIVAEMCVTGVQLYFIRRDLNLREILKMGVHYFFASIVMFLICIAIGILITSPKISIILQVLFGSVFYIGFLYFIKDEFLLNHINSIKQLMKRR